jgi:hypothetical protein
VTATELSVTGLLLSGLSIIPISPGSKKPAINWGQYMTRQATEQEVDSWDTSRIGCVCGEVSGNLECLDFDLKHADGELYTAVCELVEDVLPGLLDRVVVQSTPSAGFHWLYRLSEKPQGSLKLARNEAGEVMIETRGEGGYFVMAPSAGYELIAGSFTDLPTLTPDEHRQLHAICGSFKQASLAEQAKAPSIEKENRPGDHYNKSADPLELLQANGWTIGGRRGDGFYLVRPGKSKKDGISATWNFRGNNVLYVFSSNALPFEADKSYTPFAIYAHLLHNGDYSEASKELYSKGYGSRSSEYVSNRSVNSDGKLENTNADPKQNVSLNTTYQKIVDSTNAQCEMRWNVVKGMREINLFSSNQGWQPLHDRQENYMWCEFTGADKISFETYKRVVDSYCTRDFDPFAEYYNALPKWDGVDWIGRFAKTIKPIAEHMEPWLKYFRRWLIAVVATHHGSEPNQSVLVLKGEQGVGKTRWLNNIVPADLRTDYIYVGALDPQNKDSLVNLSENWLVNLDELETMNRHDQGQFKSYITLKYIKTRRPFARNAESLVRRASFVGSVNRSEFLTDETGSRRFLIVEVEKISLEFQKQIDIEQMYAQALSCYKAGEKYWFDGSEIDDINEVNGSFVVSDSVEEIVQELVRPVHKDTTDAFQHYFKTTTQIASELTDQSKELARMKPEYVRRKVGITMRKLGFVVVKVGFNNQKRQGYLCKVLSRADSNTEWDTQRVGEEKVSYPQQEYEPELF